MRSTIFKILGVIVGIFFVYTGITERSNLNRVKSIGKAATVQPIQRYTKRRTIYSAEFTFMTEGGQQVTQTRSFPEELIKDFESGTPVRILYNPANPREFVFEKETPSWFPAVFGVGIAVAAFVFL